MHLTEGRLLSLPLLAALYAGGLLPSNNHAGCPWLSRYFCGFRGCHQVEPQVFCVVGGVGVNAGRQRCVDALWHWCAPSVGEGRPCRCHRDVVGSLWTVLAAVGAPLFPRRAEDGVREPGKRWGRRLSVGRYSGKPWVCRHCDEGPPDHADLKGGSAGHPCSEGKGVFWGPRQDNASPSAAHRLQQPRWHEEAGVVNGQDLLAPCPCCGCCGPFALDWRGAVDDDDLVRADVRCRRPVGDGNRGCGRIHVCKVCGAGMGVSGGRGFGKLEKGAHQMRAQRRVASATTRRSWGLCGVFGAVTSTSP